MILLTLGLFIAATVLSIYFSNRRKEVVSVTEQLPTSKSHEHIAPDGTVVEHRHTYEVTDLPENAVKANKVSDVKHPIQRAWERLDLEYIREKYQPYTVNEMQEKWSESYAGSFGPNYPYYLDDAYPQKEWLQRNLELGQHFAHPGDYSVALQRRIYMIKHKDRWQSGDEETRDRMRERLHLPPDIDTWEEYEDAFLKTLITSFHTFEEATELDPSIKGGSVRPDGTFIPFKKNTVYVHINPEKGLSTFTGTKLTDEEEDALATYGVVPEGIKVIYTDEGGKPLPSDTPSPRFYERDMASLEKSLNLLQQQIEDHELLLELDAMLNPPDKGKQTDPIPHEHSQDHEHDHGHETPQTPEAEMEQQHRQHDAKRTPPQRKIPPELRKPDVVNQWFRELELLHGGQLPRDLQELRKIITELEKIRKEGEAMMKPLQRPERPTPPLPPEGSSPPPSNEDD